MLKSLAPLLLLLCVSAHAQSAPPPITGISHITFYADDLPQSQEFYGKLIGWDMVSDPATPSRVRFYVNHSQYVELVAPPVKGQPGRLDSVAFQTTDAEALRLYLGAHGISVPNTVAKDKDGSQSFLVRDPEDNKIVFTQASRHPMPEPKTAPRSLSAHIIHAGYPVHDRAALDHFYRDILGFHLYWEGGAKAGDTDWVMMQVPNGTDWIEYMLNLGATPSRGQLGSANHIAPGVISVADLQKRLEKRGWTAPAGKNPQVLGVDGKLQLDLHDPDGTRIEFMELTPVKTACCSPYTGKQPGPFPAW